MIYYLLITSVFCLYFSVSDIKKRALPNGSLFVFFIFQLFVLFPSDNFNANSFTIVFLGGISLYLLKIIAAGDVKLASIMSMAVNLNHLDTALFMMALVGGAQALYYLLRHCLHLIRYGKSDALVCGLPYGVAICIGFYVGAILSLI